MQFEKYFQFEREKELFPQISQIVTNINLFQFEREIHYI